MRGPVTVDITALPTIEQRFSFAAYPVLTLACRYLVPLTSIADLTVSDWNASSRQLVIDRAGRAKRIMIVDAQVARLLSRWCHERNGDESMLLQPDSSRWRTGLVYIKRYVRKSLGQSLFHLPVQIALATYAYGYDKPPKPRYRPTDNSNADYKRRIHLQKDTFLLASIFKDAPLPGLRIYEGPHRA